MSEHARKPVVAIVGRPNVGKSTLFNRLVGRRAAIVEDFAGVTRDRHYGDGELFGHEFIVIDTGGFEPETDDGMLKAMRGQAQLAIEESDVVIALFDGREGLLPADREITRMLERSDKPVHYGVNKIDGQRHEPLVAEFWELGVKMVWGVSAQHGPGVYDLMEAALADLPEVEMLSEEEQAPNVTKVAIIGKPNAGKSTLVNRLLGEDRLLTSDIPGTTRDSIDTWLELPRDEQALLAAETALAVVDGGGEEGLSGVEADAAALDGRTEDLDLTGPSLDEDERLPTYTWEAPEDVEALAEAEDRFGDQERDLERVREALQKQVERAGLARRYLVIDTAGVRRRKWVKTALEKYSIVKSFKSIDRAEVCLLVIDATGGVTDQDAKLASMIQAKGKACVILVNKWDIVADKDSWTAGKYVRQLRLDLGFVGYAPILFISALTGQRVHKIMAAVDRVRRNWQRRVATGELNRFVEAVAEHQPPPVHRGRRPRLYYASQVSTGPPTVLLSVNDKSSFKTSYQRFLLNRIRRRWDFEGTPIKLIWRGRKRR